MRVIVVDSDSARELVDLLITYRHGQDECLPREDIYKALDIANQILRAYMTDPLEIEEILHDFLGHSDDEPFEEHEALSTLVDCIETLLTDALQVANLDILDLKVPVLGDVEGMVALMI